MTTKLDTSVKTCPLCGAKMYRFDESPTYSRRAWAWACPTQTTINGAPHYHYRADPDPAAWIGKYCLLMYGDEWDVMVKAKDSRAWDRVMTLPPFQLMSEQQLLDKLNLLVTFS